MSWCGINAAAATASVMAAAGAFPGAAVAFVFAITFLVRPPMEKKNICDVYPGDLRKPDLSDIH